MEDYAGELLALFLAEAGEILGRMEQDVVALERDPEEMELLNGIFRAAHTLKGNCAALGFRGPSEFCHGLEDALERVRSGEACVTAALTTLLLRAVDLLRGTLADASGRTSPMSGAQSQLLRRLLGKGKTPRRARRAPAGETASASAQPSAAVASSAAAVAAPAGAAGTDAASAAAASADTAAAEARPQAAAVRTLRVEMQTLDALLNLAGEIAISRDRLAGVLERLGADAGEALELHRDADRLYAELQEAVVRARMVPLGPTFRQHVRTVRDLAESVGKSARLLLQGEDVAVDATVIDYLREPLIHMIRNALDHGIEHRDARLAAGKDAIGTIQLRARRESGQILVEVADDGAGLDREALLRRARERGLVAEGQELSGREIDQLVFAAGLSTSDKVTDISGRGVGLDVVRRSVEAVRGSIEIESRSGSGTTIRLRLPLTLAIIDGFHVLAGGRGYVVPTEAVVECQEGPRSEEDGPAASLAARDGHALPYLRLAQIFGSSGARQQRQGLVVVNQGGVELGLVVDEILGSSPTVVRPIGVLFRGIPGISGSTIRRNGEVALILDVAGLLRQVSGGVREAVA